MTVTLKRQLTEDEKTQILLQYGRTCFATGHTIPDNEPLHYDHVRAFATGGISEVNNIAPMCETHNKQKGTLSLEDFRVKLELNAFFGGGDALTLKDLLKYLEEKRAIERFGEPVAVTKHSDSVTIDSPSGKTSHVCYRCPTTGWDYFYAVLPVELIDSDDDEDHKIGLQPRYLISEKVFELFRHFQRHPVLQPSIGRVRNNRFVLFDGQHKIAALLWNRRQFFECKIYLSPDLTLLNETNISAHDKFAQTRFYSSIMVDKLGAQFGVDFISYKNLENGEQKSEAGFLRFLRRDPSKGLTTADVNKRFRSFLYDSVIRHEENKAAAFISKSNRGTDDKPLTIDMLSKSLFANFIYTEPLDDSMATDAYAREHEFNNTVALMNILCDLVLSGWNPQAGVADGFQRRSVRLLRSKAIMAWSELLRDAVCGKLDLQDAEDRARPFYRLLTKEQFQIGVRSPMQRLVSWNGWNAPADSEIDRVLADNKGKVKEWLRDHGLTTGYLMGASV
ncbi:MAG: hypothetical protein ABI885_27545 [Gammaproteobacteria bacterium]